MPSPRRRTLAIATLLLAATATAPAPPNPPVPEAKHSKLAEARYKAALDQYELAWSYFQQKRLDSFQVYLWSRLVLDARRETSETKDDRIAALRAHFARMRKMEDLATRIRRLGFGRSYEVGSAEFYRLEAEHWLELAGAKP